jgi:4-hydroxybenzoate polyprenyltransferase
VQNLILMLRPKQWTKNLIIFAGVAFSQRAGMVSDVLRSGGAFAVFCVLSGAVYIINDLFDREADRRHPTKRHRPIASGAVASATAVSSALIAIIIGIAGAALLSRQFAICAGAYLILMLAYSMWLKHVVIIDLFCIAAGFVLRAVAGAVVIDVEISSWLLVCTILLSLFLGLSKRRHELVILNEQATEHRKILTEYSPTMLDQMISVVTSSTVVAYALYTLSPETVSKFNTHGLSLTIPFVLYGIFRYLYLVHRHDLGGSPERLLVEDKPLLIAVAAWALSAGVVIYYLGPRGFL